MTSRAKDDGCFPRTVVAVYQLKAPGPGPEFSNKRAEALI